MSRSFKRHPYCGSNFKRAKKNANRKVRQYKKHKIPNGKGYKKIFCKCDIIEYRHFETFSQRVRDQEIENMEVLNGYKHDNFYENVNSRYFYMNWYRYYKMK